MKEEEPNIELVEAVMLQRILRKDDTIEHRSKSKNNKKPSKAAVITSVCTCIIVSPNT